MALLDRARNLFGPLTPDVKARIINFIDQPTMEGWHDIHGIVIAFGTGRKSYTVWRAVSDLDPRMKRAGDAVYNRGHIVSTRWKHFPNGLLVARAIKKVLDGPPEIK